MELLTNGTIDLIDSAAAAGSPAEIGRSFFSALRPFGVRALYARANVSPQPEEEFVLSRISPCGWEEAHAEPKVVSCNFIPREVRRRASAFAWSDAAVPTSRDGDFFQVLADFSMSDGVAAPVHAPGGYVGVTSLAFERLDALSPAERDAIGMAALLLHLKMRELSPPAAAAGPQLSPRERDCLGLVAAGKSDWEISETLGVAETTVISHVQNARRKLSARTRAQAVALALLAGLI
jgi:DNA-binding CsgD family transcriptional regulator